MIEQVKNPCNVAIIDNLNKLIEEYNHSLQLGNITDKELLHFLHEINYLHMNIKALYADHCHLPESLALLGSTHINPYDYIQLFKGVGEELERLGFNKLRGEMADTVFELLLADNHPLPSDDEWIKKLRRGFAPTFTDYSILSSVSSFFSSSPFNQDSKLTEQDQEILDHLSLLKILSEVQNTNPSSENADLLCQRLHILKHCILDILSDLSVSQNHKQNYRQLLEKTAHALCVIKKEIPKYQSAMQQTEYFSRSTLYLALHNLTSEEEFKLATHLNNKLHTGKEEEALRIIPCLADYEVEKLSNTNNKIYRVYNAELEIEVVFKITKLIDNQVAVSQISDTKIDKHFAKKYHSTLPQKDDAPYILTVIDLYTGGNLKNESRMLAKKSYEALYDKAASRLKELSTLCSQLYKSGIAHTDIKLDNFLIDTEGNSIIADEKGLTHLDENRGIIYIGTNTENFSPPEFLKKCYPEEGEMHNGEKFMVFTLGLALYDYLVAPVIIKDAESKQWFDLPLDMSPDIFNYNEDGNNFKSLIESMTMEDPEMRCGLSDVYQCLSEINPFLYKDLEEMELDDDMDCPALD